MSDQASASQPQDDPRIYFAAERTFLAWIRTGLALMGVGFAVARFALFLRQMRATETGSVVHGIGGSVLSGVTVVAVGVLILIAAVLQHVRTVRELRSGQWQAGRISTLAVTLALVLAVVGVGIAVYLLLLR